MLISLLPYLILSYESDRSVDNQYSVTRIPNFCHHNFTNSPILICFKRMITTSQLFFSRNIIFQCFLSSSVESLSDLNVGAEAFIDYDVEEEVARKINYEATKGCKNILVMFILIFILNFLFHFIRLSISFLVPFILLILLVFFISFTQLNLLNFLRKSSCP